MKDWEENNNETILCIATKPENNRQDSMNIVIIPRWNVVKTCILLSLFGEKLNKKQQIWRHSFGAGRQKMF